jgi:signal peptidase I
MPGEVHAEPGEGRVPQRRPARPRSAPGDRRPEQARPARPVRGEPRREAPTEQRLRERAARYNDPWDVSDRPGSTRSSGPRAKARPRRDSATYEGPSPATVSEQIRSAAEWVGIIAVAIVVALIVKAVAIQAFYIPSESMFPLLTEGDRVLVNKLSYKFGDIDRGDIVVFERPPGEPDTSITHLIKRVVGLPGDNVETNDGVLYVNGVAQEEPYINETEDGDRGPAVPPTEVPKGMLWVMGDNRANSADSRFFGAIDEDTVVGEADFLVWPVNQLKHL